MNAKIGIIQTSNFNPENYSEVVREYFTDEVYNDVEYKQLFAFEHYLNEHFDHVFDTFEDLNNWLNLPEIIQIEL